MSADARPASRPWRFTPLDPARVRRLGEALGVTPLTAQVLIARGLDDVAAARAFLAPSLDDLHDPDALPGCAAAADRIVAAVRAGRRVTIWGDYDVDGVTATALLVRCLRLAGAEADFHIPRRVEDGYGLKIDGLEALHAADPGRLVVSVDCGIASVAEADRAADLGLELIVTDHHEPGATLPAAAAVVHPRLPGADYPFGDLCGAGVAFKLAWAVAKRLGDGKRAGERMRGFLIEAMGLAAVGTVADCVPLRGENRILVEFGLRSLRHHAGPGMKALIAAAGVADDEPVTAEDVGFRLGPRINAAGRLGQASLAAELLLTSDPKRISQLVALLEELNASRKGVEKEVVAAAKKQVKDGGWADAAGLVLASKDWHPGVVGIAAGRVAERFGKPAVLLAIGRNGDAELAVGSARSHAGFDLHASLVRCGRLLERCGGHAAAAGVTVRADRIEDFREAFAADVAARHAPTAADLSLAVDAEVRLADVTLRAVKELDAKLGPFGRENPRPMFVATGVGLSGEPRTMGRDGAHFRARFTQGGGAPLQAVAFGRGEWAAQMPAAGAPLALSFTAERNVYNGFESAQLHLKEWKGPDEPLAG